eukprot:scaffold1034_cov16-Tisochrysis_lutea.AAC.2
MAEHIAEEVRVPPRLFPELLPIPSPDAVEVSTSGPVRAPWACLHVRCHLLQPPAWRRKVVMYLWKRGMMFEDEWAGGGACVRLSWGKRCDIVSVGAQYFVAPDMPSSACMQALEHQTYGQELAKDTEVVSGTG